MNETLSRKLTGIQRHRLKALFNGKEAREHSGAGHLNGNNEDFQ